MTQFDNLSQLADDLAGHFSLEPLLERILRHMIALLDSDSGSICTVDETGGTYRKEVDLGVGCLSGQTFPLDEGVTGEVVRAGGPVMFDDYSEVRGCHIAPEDRGSLHAVIGVPMSWNDSIIGVCVVFSHDPDRRFGPDDAALLELFATHAGIAIANARLHVIAAERASEAAIIAERERVARDVHETVGRGLATVLLHLDSVERQLQAGENPSLNLGRGRLSALPYYQVQPYLPQPFGAATRSCRESFPASTRCRPNTSGMSRQRGLYTNRPAVPWTRTWALLEFALSAE